MHPGRTEPGRAGTSRTRPGPALPLFAFILVSMIARNGVLSMTRRFTSKKHVSRLWPRVERLEDRTVLTFFNPPVHYPTDSGANDFAVADYNRDGVLDLMTANRFSTTVSVLLGNRNGTFRSAVNYSAAGTPWSVAAGDFNGDGLLDAITANSNAAFGA